MEPEAAETLEVAHGGGERELFDAGADVPTQFKAPLVDIELMASCGCSVAHNPVCNLRIGAGITL